MKRMHAHFGGIGLLILAAWPGAAVGMPANPNVVIAEQPDGSRIALRIHGDERFNWQADLNGYAVERTAKGVYVYPAPGVQDRLEVGKADPREAGLKRGMPPRPEADLRIRTDRSAAPAGAEPQRRIAPKGAVKNVVILMRFPNHSGRTLPSTSDVDKIFNAVGGDPVLAPTGSVRDIYLANSYNSFELNSTVFAWVTLPKSEKYYADGTSGGGAKMHEAIKDALVLADPLVNFKNFDKDGDGFVDAIAFLHSGYGAEWGGTDSDGADFKDRIWSHRWSIPTWTSSEGVKVSPYHISPALWDTSGVSPGRVGVICHETGHFFELPDLYDGGDGSGVGAWCMMANSWGFDGSQHYPPHFSAWCKIRLGWVTPTPIAPGTYTAPASATAPAVFKIDSGYASGEYLLIENRQAVGYDRKIPVGSDGASGGLAVWHIDDEKGTNTDPGFPGQPGYPGNNKHYMVAILQADGKYDLEKGVNRGDGDDLYRGGFKSVVGHGTVPSTDGYQDGTVVNTQNTISNISASGAVMTFMYSKGEPQPPTAERTGYAWADQPTTSSYSPKPEYAYNSAGGPITISRTSTGSYTVTFAGLGGNGVAGGHVQVTPYGAGNETAKVANWTSIGSDLVVNVRCFSAAGNPANARFNVLVLWRRPAAVESAIGLAVGDPPRAEPQP